MVAVRNYITEDRSLLSFHKGDIIRLQHMDGLEAGETDTQKHTKRRYWHSDIVVDQHSASLCFMSVTLCVFVCLFVYMHVYVFRQTLWLHSEEEGHASGGAEERHS